MKSKNPCVLFGFWDAQDSPRTSVRGSSRILASKILIFTAIILLVLLPAITAHEELEESAEENSFSKEENNDFISKIKSTSLLAVTITSALSIILILISILHKKKSEKTKLLLFLLLIIPIIITTLYLAGATLYLNKISETNGPVHYHADFEIWNCDERINLVAPEGLLNRVGTHDFHEHDDNRIHVEGTIIKKSDISLHHFFEALGGSISKDMLAIPTDHGLIEMKSQSFCNGEKAELQIFLYKIKNPDPKKKSGFLYEQIKLEDPESYILSPYQNVPPGDCLIIEFTPKKTKTEKLCETYKLSIEEGDLNEA